MIALLTLVLLSADPSDVAVSLRLNSAVQAQKKAACGDPFCTCGCQVTGKCDCLTNKNNKKCTCGVPDCDCGCQQTGKCDCLKAKKAEKTEKTAFDKVKKAVVKVKVTRKNDWGERTVVASGVVIDPRGFVLTCHHVINKATKIVVVLSDDTELEASVFGDMEDKDLAVLRVARGKLSSVKITRPDAEGDRVLAIGYPGNSLTVTSGVVSALGKEVEMPDKVVLKNLIQHDASINMGNSGGPLLNLDGELVGLNVAYLEGKRGISYAVSSETILDALTEELSLEKKFHLSHCLAVDNDLLVTGYSDPLKKGDKIVKAGPLMIRNRWDLERAMWGYQGDEEITLIILRNGKTLSQPIILKSLSRKSGEGSILLQRMSSVPQPPQSYTFSPQPYPSSPVQNYTPSYHSAPQQQFQAPTFQPQYQPQPQPMPAPMPMQRQMSMPMPMMAPMGGGGGGRSGGC